MSKLPGRVFLQSLSYLALAFLAGPGASIALAQEIGSAERGAQIAVGDCLAILFVDPQQPASAPMEQMASQAVEAGWAFRRVDARAEKHLAERWRIHTSPTIVLLRSGREVDRILGPVTQPELMRRMLRSSSPDSIKLVQSTAAMNTPKSKPSDIDTLVPMQQRLKTRESNPHAATQMATSAGVASVSRASSIDPQAATVRIVVDEPESHAVGSGTIVHSSAQGAVVVTCGHLFRDWTRNSVITVERFERGLPVKYSAELIDYQIEDVDIGVLVIQPGKIVPSVSVSLDPNGLREGDVAFSMGCDHGSDPTRRDSRVTKLNRYLGAPNIETAGTPVQGRSGGGLFNAQGELVGICFAADAQLDEGLYCGTQCVLERLRKFGLLPAVSEPVPSRSTPSTTALAASTVASEPANPALASTMTVILTDSSGATRQLTIDQPSEQLLDAMKQESQRTRQANSTSHVRWKVQKSVETR